MVTSSLTPAQLSRIDSYVQKAMSCRNVPGLSLSVVQNEQPIMVKGYGWANVAQRTQATNKTVFCIASVSKHITAAALGTLMNSNEPKGPSFKSKVKDILGDEFQLADKDREGKITIGDLLSHRTGMGRAGLPFMMGGYNKTELFRRMRFVQPIREFREEFQYNNIMYAVAGKVAEKLHGGGKSYEDIVIDNLFKPLGMGDATFLSRDPARWKRDFAQPYFMLGNITAEQSMEVLRPAGDITAPAGAVCLHSEDMAKWQQFLLARGKNPAGQALLQDSVFNELVKDWIPVHNSPNRQYPALRPFDPVTKSRDNYGLGLYTGYYRGYRLYFHAGFKFGFTSHLMVFPDLNISISTSNNNFQGGASSVHSPIHMFITDILLGLSPWWDESNICPTGVLSEQEPQEPSDLAQFGATFPRPITTKKGSMRPLKEYAGSYGSYAQGQMELKLVNITDIGEAIHGTYGTIGDILLFQSGQRDVLVGRGQNNMRFVDEIAIYFSANSTTDNIISLAVPIDPDSPPTFIKDLNSDELPNPPTSPPPATCPPIRSGVPTQGPLGKSVLVAFITTLMALL
ncbi:unnamed protein product [Owenia fusiformis]|uniref:Uncharacterized protein n=1 Tax=Owenia fusiformis TaxID=6347 RepID=A0A8J1Y710_OWEFU|nr:unnamed protein product [Owenia fusiformis]